MVKLLFFYFRVTISNLKNIKLYFELLTHSRLILEIQFYLCPVPFQGHQEKTTFFLVIFARINFRAAKEKFFRVY